MAQLPNTYDRRPTPKFGGVDQAAPVVPTGDEEYGRGMMSLGANITKLGAKMQAESDDVELSNLAQEAQKEANILAGELADQRGEQVTKEDFYPGWMDRFNEVKSKYTGKNKNPRIENDLNNRLGMMEINFQRGLISHTTREKERFFVDTTNAAIDVAVDTAVVSRLDDSMVGQQLNQIDAAVAKYADHYDLSAKERENMEIEARTRLHTAVIKKHLAAGDYEEAKTHYKEAVEAKDFEGDKQAAIHSLLEEFNDLNGAQDFLAEMRELGKSAAEMRDIARDRYEGKQETAALAQIAAYEAEEDKEKAFNEKAASDVIYNAWNEREGMGLEDFKVANLVALREMNPKERAGFEKWAYAEEHGKTIKTDPGAYFEALNRIQNGEQFDLTQYQPYISVPHLIKLRTEMDKDPDLLRTKAQIISDGLGKIGLQSSDLTGDPKNNKTKKAQLFRIWVESRLPRDWSKQDLEKTVADGVLKIRTNERTFWGGVLNWFNDEWAADWYKEGFAFETDDIDIQSGVSEVATEVEVAGYPATPENLLDAEAIREMGLPVTPETMADFKAAMRTTPIAARPVQSDTGGARFSEPFVGYPRGPNR
jgi:hypothetical protein